MSELTPVLTSDPFRPVSDHDEFERLAQAATSGDPRVLYLVARHRLAGIHCTENPTEALEELKLAAHEQYAPAQLTLAQCYFNGRGTPEDAALGVRTLKLATSNPHVRYAPASYEFGLMMVNDKLTGFTKRMGAKRLREAAEMGMPEAMFVLAQMYEHGDGIKQMTEEAMRLYKRAADEGLQEALDRLRRSYSPDDYEATQLVIPSGLPTASGLQTVDEIARMPRVSSPAPTQTVSLPPEPTFWEALWQRCQSLFRAKKQPASLVVLSRIRYVDKTGRALPYPVKPYYPLPETRPEFLPPIDALPYSMQPDPAFFEALKTRPVYGENAPKEPHH